MIATTRPPCTVAPVVGDTVQPLSFQGESVDTPLATVLLIAAQWMAHLEDDPYDLMVNYSDFTGWVVTVYVLTDAEVGW